MVESWRFRGLKMTTSAVLLYVCCTIFGGSEENVVIWEEGGGKGSFWKFWIIKGLAEEVKGGEVDGGRK